MKSSLITLIFVLFATTIQSGAQVVNIDIHARDAEGNTPLLRLTKFFDGSAAEVQAFNELMSAGADINDRDANGNTVLLNYIMGGRSLIALALQYHADPNARNNDHETPLMHLIFESFELNETSEIQQLLNAGADINAADEFGMTALIKCTGSSKCSAKVIKFLIDSGADKCVLSTDGNARKIAKQYDRGPQIVNMVSSPKCAFKD